MRSRPSCRTKSRPKLLKRVASPAGLEPATLNLEGGKGKVENYKNIVERHWHPLQIAAGVSVPVIDQNGRPVMEKDRDGKQVLDDAGNPIPVMRAKYTGLHALRHFFCSWCANSTEKGGLGLSLKETQVRMGHSTLAMTADLYGHLFAADEKKEREVLAAGERALMGADPAPNTPAAPTCQKGCSRLASAP
jgi:integrase